MNTYPEFSIEPFTFVAESAGEYEGELAGEEWEDEASRRGRRPRRAARPRVVARRWWRPRPWLVSTPVASEYVRWLQSALNQIMGLSLPVDGIMAPAVRNALRSFQQQQGLPIDGIVGPDTERALLAARGGQAPTKNASQPPEPELLETPSPSPAPPAQPPPGSKVCDSEGRRLLANGVFNKSTTLTLSGGQVMNFTLKNLNVLGTTIRITVEGTKQSQAVIIPPLGTATMLFSIFGAEPMSWRFRVETSSSAFLVEWQLCSTWIPGDPPNR